MELLPPFRTIGQRDLVYKPEKIMGALVATDYKQPKQIIEMKQGETDKMKQIKMQNKFTIRKLTPTECWKLQGFNSEDCEKARNLGVSDTNLYKQAGNGIVTNCVELLFEHLYKAQIDDTYICMDENFT